VPSNVRRHGLNRRSSIAPGVPMYGCCRLLLRGSFRLIVTPGVTLCGKTRSFRRRRFRPMVTPGVTLGGQSRFCLRRSLRLIVAPCVPGASGVSRAHQTQCQSDPSNFHFPSPSFSSSRTQCACTFINTRAARSTSRRVTTHHAAIDLSWRFASSRLSPDVCARIASIFKRRESFRVTVDTFIKVWRR
jgi:hypothetical protein